MWVICKTYDVNIGIIDVLISTLTYDWPHLLYMLMLNYKTKINGWTIVNIVLLYYWIIVKYLCL